MFKKTINAAAALMLMSSVANADVFDDLAQTTDSVNSAMQTELGDIINTLPGQPGELECICYMACKALAAMARGEFGSADEAANALATGLIQDQAGGISSAIKNGGKFDPDLVGTVTFKMKYTKDFKGKAGAKMLKKAAVTILK